MQDAQLHIRQDLTLLNWMVCGPRQVQWKTFKRQALNGTHWTVPVGELIYKWWLSRAHFSNEAAKRPNVCCSAYMLALHDLWSHPIQCPFHTSGLGFCKIKGCIHRNTQENEWAVRYQAIPIGRWENAALRQDTQATHIRPDYSRC